jgi:hypothetical protein
MEFPPIKQTTAQRARKIGPGDEQKHDNMLVDLLLERRDVDRSGQEETIAVTMRGEKRALNSFLTCNLASASPPSPCTRTTRGTWYRMGQAERSQSRSIM